MTIDETIKYEKMCFERRDAFVDRTTEEHKQLVEWLEELKALKSDSIPIIHGKAELELHDKEIRAKAIDDMKSAWDSRVKDLIKWCKDKRLSGLEQADLIFDEIAEQMKGE